MVFFIIYILCSIVFATVVYNSLRKNWYDTLKEDVLKSDTRDIALMITIFTALIGPFGIISLILFWVYKPNIKFVLFWEYPEDE